MANLASSDQHHTPLIQYLADEALVLHSHGACVPNVFHLNEEESVSSVLGAQSQLPKSIPPLAVCKILYFLVALKRQRLTSVARAEN